MVWWLGSWVVGYEYSYNYRPSCCVRFCRACGLAEHQEGRAMLVRLLAQGLRLRALQLLRRSRYRHSGIGADERVAAVSVGGDDDGGGVEELDPCLDGEGFHDAASL